jgi:hypothetical protein
LENLIKELRDEADGLIDSKPDECYRALMYAAADELEDLNRRIKIKDLDNKHLLDRLEGLAKKITPIPNEDSIQVALPRWVVATLANPGASMSASKVDEILSTLVSSCELAKAQL